MFMSNDEIERGYPISLEALFFDDDGGDDDDDID